MIKVYLASPFSHEDKLIEKWRYEQVCKAAALLQDDKHLIFSPIAHSFGLAMHGGLHNKPWEGFWKEIDFAYISMMDALWVLTLTGWRSSIGVTDEIRFARSRNMPVKLVSMESVTHGQETHKETSKRERHLPEMHRIPEQKVCSG